jgi:hypothetical protein
MDSCPRGDLHTLPTATQLTQPVTTCVRPLVSYAGLVEQMTWLTRKSHRSSAPSSEQGRKGARPNHSPGAVVPNAAAAEVGPRAGGAETAGPAEPPDPRDAARDSGPQDTGSQDTGEWQSAIRAAAENTAFRAASSRSVWPGTEDRRAELAPGSPRPSPGGPGVSSFGPLGAGLPPDAGQAGHSGRPDEQIWEPRRLYQQPLLKPRRRGDPASPSRRSQPQRAQQTPEQQGPPQGTVPRNVRSGETAVPKPESPEPESPEPESPEPESTEPESTVQQGAAQQHRDIPVRRFAITAGSDPARGSGPYSAGSHGPSGPGGPDSGPDSGPGSVGTERMADRLHVGDLMADSRMRIWKRRLLVAIVAGLVFTFIFTWRAGLTAAVLAAIADAIYRSRTTASMPPGVRLTGAQKRTQRQLARMERSGYRALHSRPIPGSREFIDHFVVGPTGAYAIDSESWDKRLPIRTRNARQLYHGPFTKKDRLEHARWEAQQASDQLTSELRTTVYVRPVLAVYGPRVPWIVATIREVDVFSGDRLRKYLRRNAALGDRPKLNAGEIEQIYAAAARVLPLNNAAQRTPVG